MNPLEFDQMITFVYVSDQNKSKEFYEEIMGFPLRLDQGNCRIVETNQKGGGLLGYCLRESDAGQVITNFIVTLVTPSVDEWYEYLLSRGVQIAEPPKFNPEYKIYHFFFQDPDGHMFEIQEFKDPAWLM